MLSEKKLFTVLEMSEMIQVTPETVKDYIRDGKLTAFKVGYQWRFTEEDLYKFVEARRKEREGVE